MEKVHLFKYLKSIINDDYSIDVLYFCIRRWASKNGMSFRNVSELQISKKFHEEKVTIDISDLRRTRIDVICLMMSIKAIKRDRSLLAKCSDNNLLFHAYPVEGEDWIDNMSIILNNIDDKDFCQLCSMLKYFYDNSNSTLPSDQYQSFYQNTVKPEYRNLLNFYRGTAHRYAGSVYKEVICNNAFVCDESLTYYKVTSGISYVGNTAFAYCPNLEKIEFEREVLFGKYPIIECPKLSAIIVPGDSVYYFKTALPYYDEIIISSDDVADPCANDTPISVETVDCKTELLETSHKSDFSNILTLFDKKTDPCMIIWFWALLDFVNSNKGFYVSFDEMTSKMISLVWPIYYEFGLNFGKKNIMSVCAQNLIASKKLSSSFSSDRVASTLKSIIHKVEIKSILSTLTKDVPYRFLSPWISSNSITEVVEKSNSSIYDAPYSIQENAIIVDEDWYEFFQTSQTELIDYLNSSLDLSLKQYNSDMDMLKYNLWRAECQKKRFNQQPDKLHV